MSDEFVSDLVFDVVDEFLDVLLVALRTDHQHVIGVDHDVFLEPFDNGQFTLFVLDNTSFGVVEQARSALHIAFGVLGRVLVERTPGADIGPSEVAAPYINVARLLHHAEVDRNAAACGIDVVDGLLFGRGAVFAFCRSE